MHGKVDWIHHDGRGLFVGLPNPFQATRYHSLVIRPGTLSPDYEITAWSELPDGGQEIMGVRHKRLPVFGVQFHPESFLTHVGKDILKRFLEVRPVLGDMAPAPGQPAHLGEDDEEAALHGIQLQTLDPTIEPIED